MTAVFAVFLVLLLAGGAFVGANFCEPGSLSQQGLIGFGGALLGAILPSLPKWLQTLMDKATGRDVQRGHATPKVFMLLTFVGLAGFAGSLLTPNLACHNVKPDVFFEAVVDCAKVNPQKSPAASSVVTCLVGALAGNPAACLSQLVTVMHFTVDEVACVVADIAQRENSKVGTAEATRETMQIRDTAVAWMVSNRISIINTYSGAP